MLKGSRGLPGGVVEHLELQGRRMTVEMRVEKPATAISAICRRI